LGNVWAFVVLGKSMIDAVNPAAVSANVRDELFRAADCAVIQDNLLIEPFSLLKSCLRTGPWVVTLQLEPWLRQA
jgi:hypothetical protein